MKKIVIQGIRGAFHEVAARQFFGEGIEVVPALSFQRLFELAQDGKSADAAILAIENSLAGSILGNYKLLRNSNLTVVGEVFLPIGQHLMALPGVSLADLHEVRSHPMALAQCAAFFKKHPHIRLVESDDTAASAERVARHHAKHIGAIASQLAAQTYGLDIVAPNIEDDPLNYTRFLALLPSEHVKAPAPDADKCSICFVAPHQPGSLSVALQSMAANGANLTKIQSLPIEQKVWKYRFFMDYTFANLEQNKLIIKDLEQYVTEISVLGTYKSSSLNN
jgi:prephenate dehydratase